METHRPLLTGGYVNLCRQVSETRGEFSPYDRKLVRMTGAPLPLRYRVRVGATMTDDISINVSIPASITTVNQQQVLL